jgi:DNA-binding HxlR family transcriptional regulator
MPMSEKKAQRPIMALLDILGQRWVLRIIWELRDAPLTFRALRERCDQISPTVLNQRLALLRENGLLELVDAGYQPTQSCKELGTILMQLSDWSKSWDLTPEKPN